MTIGVIPIPLFISVLLLFNATRIMHRQDGGIIIDDLQQFLLHTTQLPGCCSINDAGGGGCDDNDIMMRFHGGRTPFLFVLLFEK